MKTRSLIFLSIALSLFFLLIALTVELTDNEAYYWSWSLRPDLSYFDHPPLLAWAIWISTHIFGKTNFAIRILALLNFWMSSYLFARWMSRFNLPWNNALALCIGSPLFFIFSWITLPDVLFLPLALFSIVCVLDKRFIWAGVVLGLTLLSKWHAMLVCPGLLISVILTNMDFTKKIKALIQTFGIAAVMQLPVVFWNYQHNWIAFKYHLINRHTGEWGSAIKILLNLSGFISGFVILLGVPFFYLLIKHLKSHKFKPSFDRDDFILLSYGLPFLLVFALSAAKGETRIYWAGFAFFPFSILFLRHKSIEIQQGLQKIAIYSSCLMMIILSAALYLPVGYYIRPIVENFRSFDIRFSPRGDMLGWEQWVRNEAGGKHSLAKNVLFQASDIRLASQLLWNSDLDFGQVTVINPIKQYIVWKRPEISDFSKIIYFGDNRRRLPDLEINDSCKGHPINKKYNIYLLDKIVKVIEKAECRIKTSSNLRI